MGVHILGVHILGPTTFYFMGPKESVGPVVIPNTTEKIVHSRLRNAIVADGKRNARMKQLLSVLQLVRNAELVERRDTSLGVAASTLSSQGQCNLFHTLTHGTQGCSCSTPLTAWRKKKMDNMLPSFRVQEW